MAVHFIASFDLAGTINFLDLDSRMCPSASEDSRRARYISRCVTFLGDGLCLRRFRTGTGGRYSVASSSESSIILPSFTREKSFARVCVDLQDLAMIGIGDVALVSFSRAAILSRSRSFSLLDSLSSSSSLSTFFANR